MQISHDAKIYLRPTAFVDAPFDLDERVYRLAGGMLWYSAVEVIARSPGGKRQASLVAVADLEQFLDTLPSRQQAAARETLGRLASPRAPLQMGERTIRLDQTQVMGILNVTPDSFSDGGMFDGSADAASTSGFAMAEAGAAIIDVGGESTRPGAATVWEGDEMPRVVPVVEALCRGGTAVSIDTRKAAVMEAAIAAGAAMVNDVSALLFDQRSAEVVSAAGCPIVLMHHRGDPQTMQDAPHYDDVLLDVCDWLEDRIAAAVAAGIDRAKILIDPGIGFGKSVRHNLALLNGLALFHGLGCPILLGVSRKRFIGALDNEAPVERRLGGSVAMALWGAQQGAQILRVHDVAETLQAIRSWRGLRDEALTPLV